MAVLKSVTKENTKVATGGIKKKKSSYPTIPVMVNAAIKELKKSNGSSVHSIRKYLGEIYKASSDIVYMHIKKYLRSAVEEGKLIQTRGHGAYGSFRLPSAKKLKALNGATGPKKPIKSLKKAADAPKQKSAVKKPNEAVNNVAIGIKKAAANKKPIAKIRFFIKIALKPKPTKAKRSTMKNIKTPKTRSALRKK